MVRVLRSPLTSLAPPNREFSRVEIESLVLNSHTTTNLPYTTYSDTVASTMSSPRRFRVGEIVNLVPPTQTRSISELIAGIVPLR